MSLLCRGAVMVHELMYRTKQSQIITAKQSIQGLSEASNDFRAAFEVKNAINIMYDNVCSV